MSFTSLVFFLFLPVVLILYRVLAKPYRLPLLLCASYFFYAYYDVRLLILIFITTLVSYLSARCMEGAETQKGKKLAVVFTIIVCLGILFIFKYFNFAVNGVFSIMNLFGADISFQGFNILLPMGISFYVFQTMSYTFDVYNGTVPAEKNLGSYSLFVVFFPQLVAGPIERPGDLLPQLKKLPVPTGEDFSEAFRYFLRGYAKKILIADFTAGYVDTAYNQIPSAGGAALLGATMLFALQIYCDFSGYSDIALGCARFMGIRLSENFKRPYSAISIRDFWHRWHISLTRWFTDYLYIPLGGSRKGLLRQCRNILITFLVSGLWHGASLNYVIWGGLHGLYLTAENIFFRKNQNAVKHPLLGRIITFLLVCFAWIFFRSATLQDAFSVISSIFTDFRLSNLLVGLGLNWTELFIIFLLILLLPFLEKLPMLSRFHETDYKEKACSAALLYFFLTLAIFLCRCLILTGQGSTAFIYFQF